MSKVLCKDCFYGEGHPAVRFVLCHLNPVPVVKNPDDWCAQGRHKADKPDGQPEQIENTES